MAFHSNRLAGCGLIGAMLLATACSGGGSGASSPSSPSSGSSGPNTATSTSTVSCRNYATTSTTLTTTTAGASNTRSLTCGYDTGSNKLDCTMTLSSCGVVPFVVNYPSRTDFVDEVGTIPPRMLQTAQITAGNSCNITNGSYSYDAQKRLLSYTINGLTYSYSAWDASGRPTTGVVTGGPTPVNESWSYNDAARSATLVQSTSAGFTTTTYLWDANGNPVTVVVVAGGTTSTSTTTTTGTAQVCK